MANHNAKGKRAIFGEVAKKYSIRLYSWEREPVKELLKKLREERKKNII